MERVTAGGPFSYLLAGQPRWAVLLEASVLTLMIGWVDYITGYDINLTVFYALPILMAVWYADFAASVLVAILCTITWSLADYESGHPYSALWIPVWDTWIRLLFFIFVVFGGSAIRSQIAETRARVELLEPFHVLARISPVGIFRSDVQGRCLYMNERWLEMLGRRPIPALAGDVDAIHPPGRPGTRGPRMGGGEGGCADICFRMPSAAAGRGDRLGAGPGGAGNG